MLPEIEQLLILQDKDQTLKRLNHDLKRFPQEQERVKQKLASDTEAVKQAKTKLQENEVAIKNLQLQIGTRKETITRLKIQQFETRKNDEYSALGNEVVRYGAEVTKLEDSEIELMEKAEELKSKTPDQLRDSLVQLKKEAFNLRFQQATNQLENTARMRAVRRDVARIKTVLGQKAAEAAK